MMTAHIHIVYREGRLLEQSKWGPKTIWNWTNLCINVTLSVWPVTHMMAQWLITSGGITSKMSSAKGMLEFLLSFQDQWLNGNTVFEIVPPLSGRGKYYGGDFTTFHTQGAVNAVDYNGHSWCLGNGLFDLFIHVQQNETGKNS